jgi:peptidoglycan/xylan/chitin deacetylase (PgdA/CDA1 family)
VTPVLLALLAAAEPGIYSCTPPDTTSREADAAVRTRLPVLCYHGIGEGGGLSVSPARFRADLEALCARGFFLVTADDLLEGLERVPSDRSPVMITFDDGWQGQFNMLTGPDGSATLDPLCAVGLMEDFCGEHPEFGRGATFFISWDKVPFGQQDLLEEKLNFLLDNGYCIGNHSRRHQSLMGLDPDLWEQSMTGALERFEPLLGIRTCRISTAAWPGGRIPEGEWASSRLASMEWNGHPAARLGFVVDGALAEIGGLDDPHSAMRLGRIDMGLYSVTRLMAHSGVSRGAALREDLHDPMPWRIDPPGPPY